MGIQTPRNKEEFYQSITPDTGFGADFCRKLYGYDTSYPGFADKVLKLFESFGRPNVKYIFALYVWAEMYFWAQGIKEVGAPQYVSESINKNYERQEKECRKKEKITKSQVASQILKW